MENKKKFRIETFSRQNENKLLQIIKRDIKDGTRRILITGISGSGKTHFYRLLKANKIDCFDFQDYCDYEGSDVCKPRYKEIPEDKDVYLGWCSDIKKFRTKMRISRTYVITASPEELIKEYKNRSEDNRRADREYYKAKFNVNESTIAYMQNDFIKGL